MKAVVFPEENVVELAEVPQPTLVEPDDAILRVTTTAICGSDLHRLHGAVGGFSASHPIGHEFVGVVEEIGSGVKDVAVGERYVATMLVVCGRCPACIRGDHTSCSSMVPFGAPKRGDDWVAGPSPGLEGGQAEYVRVPRADVTLTRVPDEVTDDDIVLVSDILSTAFTVLHDVDLRPGEDVAVVGAGPVGQLIVLCAPLFGAARVFAIDLVPDRLRRAEQLGATPVTGDDAAARIREATGGAGVDVALDAVGAHGSLGTALAAVKNGGRVGLVNAVGDFTISPTDLFWRRISVIPTLGNPHRWREPLTALIASGRLRPSQIVSDRLSLDDAVRGYSEFEGRKVNKVVLKTEAR
jgi:threonine dehydrogenase-like Zn-dependent dehydrogenase